MSVSLQKIEGVESVSVALNEGKARLALKRGNNVTLDQVRRLVERNGFTPKAAAVVAEADVVAGPAGQPQLRVSGTNETFPVATTTGEGLRNELRKQLGKRLIVEGVVPSIKENQAAPMEVKEVTPPTR